MAGPMELMKDFVVRGCVSGEDPSKQPDWRLKYTLSVWGSDSWAPGLGGRARQGWGKLGKRQRRRQHSSPRAGLRRQEELGAIGEPSIALRECAARWGGARCVEELGELLGRGRSRQQPDGCQGGGEGGGQRVEWQRPGRAERCCSARTKRTECWREWNRSPRESLVGRVEDTARTPIFLYLIEVCVECGRGVPQLLFLEAPVQPPGAVSGCRSSAAS